MFSESFWGVEGFEELRRYLKHGTDMSRDIASLLQERSEIELAYSKALLKIGTKLSKATHLTIGTLAESWCLAGAEMEAEAEQHRVFGQALLDDVNKLIKVLVEAQTKARKPIEAAVEKTTKTLNDRRNDESKCKKNAFSLTKDREKTIDMVSVAKDGKSKGVSEKDIAKLEKKVAQLEDSLAKADKEYYDASRKAEAARQDWESMVFKACGQLQTIEEQRITQMQDMLNRYNSCLSAVGPKIIKSCEKLGMAVEGINVTSDVLRISEIKGKRPNQSEQILLDYYAEDRTNHMDMGRRRQALEYYVNHLEQELDKERKGREGVERLMEVYKGQPSFADAVTQEEGFQRLANVNAMLRYLEASHVKIGCILADLSNQPKPQSQLTTRIERTKDKQGFSTSILRMSSAVSEGFAASPTSASTYRPPAEGGRIDSMYDDDFDGLPAGGSVSRCTAVYEFIGNGPGELTIRPGDIITVFEKHEDGWWHGELNRRVGLFPGSYVK